MSGYPVVVNAEHVRALVVGGGQVAARKIAALLDAGATVRVVAPQIAPNTAALVETRHLSWTQAEYSSEMIADANFVFAATSSEVVNSAILSDARKLGRLVNVASNSMAGDFFTPAVHKMGATLIAVFTAGVPAAAARIRDFIGRTVDPQVAEAVARLATMRSERLARGQTEEWRAASSELLGDDFLASLKNGDFERRMQRWV